MIGDSIAPMLIVTGGLQAGFLLGAVAPAMVLRLLFGVDRLEPVHAVVTRHWSLMVGGLGLLVVYAAFDPGSREPIMLFAAAEKLWIAALVLGTSLRRHRLAAAIASADLVLAIVYLAYLLGA